MNSTYAYLYDDFLSERKHERRLASLETTLNALGLYGNISRLTLFRSAKDLIHGMVHRGAETLVIVGNDDTLRNVMWLLPDIEITIGYVPLVEPSAIATMLGIPLGVSACQVLSTRFIETFDIGYVAARPFLLDVCVSDPRAFLDVRGEYRIAPQDRGLMTIQNLGGMVHGSMQSANPKDGYLEARIFPELDVSRQSFWKRIEHFPETRLFLSEGCIRAPEPIEIRIDGQTLRGKEFPLSIAPKKIRFITGHTRLNLGLPRRPRTEKGLPIL